MKIVALIKVYAEEKIKAEIVKKALDKRGKANLPALALMPVIVIKRNYRLKTLK